MIRVFVLMNIIFVSIFTFLSNDIQRRGGGGGSSYIGGCLPGTGSTISGTTGTSITSTLPGNALASAGWISGVGIGGYSTTDGTTPSWGTVASYSAPTLGSTSIGSGATVTTINGLTKIVSATHASLDASGYEQDISLMNIMGAW